ncbi:aldo/keto reductase [Clostridia bacterium]|nr:aldo/keto reductase [Clostridia bacterium]
MQYRRDERGGNKLSALGFGCMRFPKAGAGFDLDKSRELILEAIDSGVNYFDTAYIYGNSEEVLGKILTPDIRGKIYLATKMPQYIVKKTEDYDKIFEKQLTRLCTDYIDYYLMHMLTGFDAWEYQKNLGCIEWAEKKKAEGKIKNFGFSYHGGRDGFKQILNDYNWDFVQIQYNYIDEHNQAARSGLEAAAAKNIPVIIMEPLLGGKLAAALPDGSSGGLSGGLSKEAVAAFTEGTPQKYALRWIWNQPEVTVILSGMSTLEQLRENVAVCESAVPGCLTEKESAAVETAKQAYLSSIKIPCTACGYCMPCPFGVDIPTAFSMYNMIYTQGRKEAVARYMQNMNAFGSDTHFASRCKKCGKCKSHCPQSIQIPAELASAAKALEPLWLKAVVKVYKTVFARKKQRRHMNTGSKV